MLVRMLFVLFLTGVLFCPAALSEGVLTAGTEKDAKKTSQGTAFQKSPVQKAKVKFKLTAPPRKESPAPAPSAAAPAEDRDDLSIFKDVHPREVTPTGTSPFVKQVSAHLPASYQRRPIVGYGKAKAGLPAGSVRRRTDSERSADA